MVGEIADMIVKHRQTETLKELVAYYHDCLALERQGELVFDDETFFKQSSFPPWFFGVNGICDSWDELLATKSAKDALDLAKREKQRAVLFATFCLPFATETRRSGSLLPVFSVVGLSIR
ncbi:MAG: valine--tRNA ligase [Armatimonadetes bacterium]|nr:valine--tRNA ligase [Armatimonadota bacterium]MDW8028255.1 hypothetical protein [Armatimonadota bacterium]